jgi:acyl-CoA synthetase (AMP-forming)/AMP-acid ligase II
LEYESNKEIAMEGEEKTIASMMEESRTFEPSPAFRENEIGPIARPDKIHFADAFPRTRSGKIMRRILKKIASGDIDDLGDTSNLADPEIVQELVQGRQ